MSNLPELLQEKLDNDEALRKYALELSVAKRTAAAHGRYMPIDQYANLEARVNALRNKSQRLQSLIAIAKKEQRAITDDLWAERFVQAARKLLDRDTFTTIVGAVGPRE